MTVRRFTAAAPPATRASFADNAYRAIKARILDNHLQPNQQVLVHELADMLGMSRTPVQQALVRLESEGLIEIRPRHGMRVLPLSAADYGDIYDILAGLEPMAVELIARQKQPMSRLENLEIAVLLMEKALGKKCLIEWIEADEQFHRAIADTCGNARLRDLMGMFWEQAHRVRMMLAAVEPLPVASTSDHRGVLDALVRGDADAARELHRLHRMKVRKRVVEVLQQSLWPLPADLALPKSADPGDG